MLSRGGLRGILCCHVYCCAVQVSRAEVLQLVSKAPALLWSSPAHLTQVTGYLQEVSGLSMQQLFKTFLTWPNMATFSQAKLMDT